MVGRRHRLELTTCRLAGFADVDCLRQRQVAHLQQLVASALVADADDDPVADHRFLDSAEVARSRQSTDFAEKRLKSLASLLRPTVEDVALVRHIDSADAEGFESSDDRIQLLAVVLVLEFHRSVDVVRVVTYTSHENGSTLFLTLIKVLSARSDAFRSFRTVRENVASRPPRCCHLHVTDPESESSLPQPFFAHDDADCSYTRTSDTMYRDDTII